MLLPNRNNLYFPSERKIKESKIPSDVCPRLKMIGRAQNDASSGQGPITRIKEKFGKVELSFSSYDTAWVAMVPSRDSPHQPHFHECLKWIMENQQPDGSWGLQPTHPLLVKDSLSSTLASVLALQKWQVGESSLNKKGLDFIASNCWAAAEKNQFSPIGFDIIFPEMAEYAKDMGLNLPLKPPFLDAMLSKRDLEVERGFSRNKGSSLAYVAEGLSKLYDWKDLMKHQRSNGSLFNSPSTTAAALIHLHDDKCFEYLQSLLKRYKNAVPSLSTRYIHPSQHG